MTQKEKKCNNVAETTCSDTLIIGTRLFLSCSVHFSAALFLYHDTRDRSSYLTVFVHNYALLEKN